MKCNLFIIYVLISSLIPPTVEFAVTRSIGDRANLDHSLSAARLSDTTTACSTKKLIHILSTRYGTATGNWTKTRNYSYRQKNLTLGQVESVLDFLENHFDSSTICTILQTSPRILRKSLNTLEPTTSFLRQFYGYDLFQEAVSRNPDLLLASGVGYTNDELDNYLLQTLGMPNSMMSRLKQSAPFFFQLSLEKIQSITDYLVRLLLKGGFSKNDSNLIVSKVMVAHPHLFALSVETNLQPRIQFLKEICELEERNVATLIKTSSGILGLSVEDNLKPTLEYLAELLGSNDDNAHDEKTPPPMPETAAVLRQNKKPAKSPLHKCILKHPPILALSRANLQQKVDYFHSIGPSVATRIALKCPVVYSLSLTDNVIPTVSFLAKVWTHEATADLLRDYPNVLTLSLEGNLQPTMTFYNKTGYTALDDDWNVQPDATRIRGRYIAASLFTRLLPRWHYWLAHSATANVRPPLHVLVGTTDEGFCQALHMNVDDYLRFQQESAPRLKFSSQFDTWLKTGRAIDV